MSTFTYEEIRAHLDRFVEANRLAGEKGAGWDKMASFYTEDAIYSWNTGPNEEFVARGRDQLRKWAFGTEMAGLEGWRYPYIRTLIDPEKGEVVVFWRQQAPVNDPMTNQPYEVSGTGGSWFRYAGNGEWGWQRDWFDLGNAGACFLKMAERGVLSDTMKERLEAGMKGEVALGHVPAADFNWLNTVVNLEDI